MEDFHLPYESILVSSVQSGLYAARARIFNSYTWLRGYNDKNSFLQIGNGIDEYLFTAIATQGHLTMRSAVVKFQLSFSRDGLHWFYYRENGDIKVKTFLLFYYEFQFSIPSICKSWGMKNVCGRLQKPVIFIVFPNNDEKVWLS